MSTKAIKRSTSVERGKAMKACGPFAMQHSGMQFYVPQRIVPDEIVASFEPGEVSPHEGVLIFVFKYDGVAEPPPNTEFEWQEIPGEPSCRLAFEPDNLLRGLRLQPARLKGTDRTSGAALLRVPRAWAVGKSMGPVQYRALEVVCSLLAEMFTELTGSIKRDVDAKTGE